MFSSWSCDWISALLIRGGHNTRKFSFELAYKLFPFSMPHRFQKHKAHLWEVMGSASSKSILFGKKYKGCQKCIKGKNSLHVFQFCYFKTNFPLKSDERVWLLGFRRSLRHQDRRFWPMSYFYVICCICHTLSYYDIWRIWHKNMTSVKLVDLGV